MNTSQLKSILGDIAQFGGVFAADDIKFTTLPCFIIVNTDVKGQPGTHWVCMKLDKNQCEFFDSLGRAPYFYHDHWHTLLLKIGGTYLYNNQRVQGHMSTVCGHYCIFYILQHLCGASFQSILNKFDKVNYKYNDAFVLQFVGRRSLETFN